MNFIRSHNLWWKIYLKLLQGRNQVKMTEVAYCKESITPDNVYIIDNGLQIFQVDINSSLPPRF